MASLGSMADFSLAVEVADQVSALLASQFGHLLLFSTQLVLLYVDLRPLHRLPYLLCLICLENFKDADCLRFQPSLKYQWDYSDDENWCDLRPQYSSHSLIRSRCFPSAFALYL